MLVWATSICLLHLRPQLAPLHSPPGCQYAIPATLWQTFLSALTPALQLPACPVGLYIPVGAHWNSKARSSMPKPPSAKVQFIRASDPEATHTRLRRESVESLKWFATVLGNTPERPLAMEELFQCLAAADACAEGTIGIGGWVVTSTAVAWFAETWSAKVARQVWPF